jgi:hypothetical protein
MEKLLSFSLALALPPSGSLVELWMSFLQEAAQSGQVAT